MVREIVHDPAVLRKKSVPATEADAETAVDLIDTLQAHLDEYPGLAACMIGEHKRIIAIAKGQLVIVLFNPRILGRSESYIATEECPVLGRVQPVKRFKTIRLVWQDAKMKEHFTMLDGFQAQEIQHLIDHCDGVMI